MPSAGRKRPLSEYRPAYYQLLRRQWEWMCPGNTDWRDRDEIETDSEFWGDSGASGYEIMSSAHISLKAMLREWAEADFEKTTHNADLVRALKALTQPEQTVVYLWAQGFSLAEIAEQRGAGKSTIKDTVYRAVSKMREAFGLKAAA